MSLVTATNKRAVYCKGRRSALHTPTVPTLLCEHAVLLENTTKKSIPFVGTAVLLIQTRR